MANLFIRLNWQLNRLLVLLGFRRKRVYWGVVYDSATKQPIDPAIIKLVDAHTGQVTQSGMTDFAGRYGFLSEPGKYKILVQKSNYRFPSQWVSGVSDGLFANLYHGEFFIINEESEVISFNIPLDAERFDWNQQAKLQRGKFAPYLEIFFYKLAFVTFWFLFCIAALRLYQGYNQFSIVVLVVCSLIILLAIFLPQPRLWGRIIYKGPIQSSKTFILELTHWLIPDVVVAKCRVLEGGKFFLLAKPGVYLLKVLELSEDNQNPKLAKQQKVRIGLAGVLARNLRL